MFFFNLLSEAFLPESVSEQGQCSLRLLLLLICQVRSILILACRRLSFLQSFLKRISLMPSTSFTHSPQPNLIYQPNFLSCLQTRANVKNAMFLSSVNVKTHFLTCLAHDGSAWPDTKTSHREHCLHVINSTRM